MLKEEPHPPAWKLLCTVDASDGPAERISVRRAAWLVDGAIVLAAARGPFGPPISDRPERRSSDARPRP
jgi:hypothetical protein